MVETGLGGRLDATNVLNPTVTIITEISMDHAEILGPTLADIAGEKAGIIKPGIPTVIGPLPPAARQVIRQVCRRQKAPLVPLKKDDFSIRRSDLSLSFSANGTSFTRLTPALAGVHQLGNCALVLKAVGELRRGGFSISKSGIRQGLEATRWPGRFQVVPGDKASPTMILDVCHNTGGAAAFVDTFKRTFPSRKAQMIIGFVKRKPHQEMVDLLSQVTGRFWLVPLASRRGVDVIELERNLDWKGVPVRRLARLNTAHRQLTKQLGPDGIGAVVGSHYLVGEFLSRFGEG